MAENDIRIEIADRNGAKVLDLTKFKGGVSFDFSRPGGCNTASFTLPWDFEDWSSIGALYEVAIYVVGAPSNPFWSGVIYPDFEPTLANEEDIKINCVGWSKILHFRITDDQIWNMTPFGSIIFALLNSYAHSRIIVDAGNIGNGT